MTWTDLVARINAKTPRVLSNRAAAGLLLFGKNLSELAKYQGYQAEFHWYGLALKAIGWTRGDKINTSSRWQQANFKPGSDTNKTRHELLTSLMVLASKLDEQGYPYSNAREQGFEDLSGDTMRSPIGSATSLEVLADEVRATMHTDYPEMLSVGAAPGRRTSADLKLVLDVTRLFLDQDYRWSQMLSAATAAKHPAAPKARAFMKGPWEQSLHQWLDYSGQHDPETPISDRERKEVLRNLYGILYPAASTAGFPETSFLLASPPGWGSEEAWRRLESDELATKENTMNSPDPWRNVIGGGGHHGGGHHHHGGGGGRRRFFGGDYGYGYPYPYGWDRDIVIVNEGDDDQDARTLVGHHQRGVYRARDGVLAEVAPVLAPATGGFTVAIDLDSLQRLNVAICVDGKSYRSSMDLAPAIAAVMAKLARVHSDWHAGPFVNPLPRLPAAPSPDAQESTVVGAADCGTRVYTGVTVPVINAILKHLHDEGADITGNNPWDVVTHSHGVELRGTWNRAVQTLTLEITGKDGWPVTCTRIWAALDEDLAEVGATPAPSGEQAVAAIDVAVRAAGDAMVGALLEQHVGTVCAGWFDDLKHSVSRAVHGIEGAARSAYGTVGHTLAKLKGPIAVAAGFAAAGAASAIPGVGVALGPIAGNLAEKLVASAAGDGSAKKAVQQAMAEAQADPKLGKALDLAHKAVAQTTVAYHIAETAKAAAAGDASATEQIQKLGAKAAEGDPAAQVAMDLANQTADAAADSATAVSGDPGSYQAIARRAVAHAYHQRRASAFGYLRSGNHQRVYYFGSPGEARAWYRQSMPGDYTAVFDGRNLATPIAEKFGDDVEDDVMVGTGGPRVEIIGAALDTIRKQSAEAAAGSYSRVVGLIRRSDGTWGIFPFTSADDADDWFGNATDIPSSFVYAAYYDKGDPTWPGPLNEAVGQGRAPKPASEPIQRGIARTAA